ASPACPARARPVRADPHPRHHLPGRRRRRRLPVAHGLDLERGPVRLHQAAVHELRGLAPGPAQHGDQQRPPGLGQRPLLGRHRLPAALRTRPQAGRPRHRAVERQRGQRLLRQRLDRPERHLPRRLAGPRGLRAGRVLRRLGARLAVQQGRYARLLDDARQGPPLPLRGHPHPEL
ncbi:MAG: hypothetical protein AVDCRST_MAG07-727, partial [uncultured Frankineae bacterium]